MDPNQRTDLMELNKTELLTIYRQQHGGLVLRRSLELARIVELVETGGWPRPEEVSETGVTRQRFEYLLNRTPLQRKRIESQLPCKGWRNGHCTVYPCSEGRHAACYTENEERVNAVL